MYYAKKYPEEMAVSPGCEIIVLLKLAYLDAISIDHRIITN